MKKGVVITGALFIMFAIILGAFGAHALKEILSDANLKSLETGIRYQMYMGLSILTLGLNYHKFRKKHFKVFYAFMLSGTLLFSFSIYGLVWADTAMLFSLKKVFGPITPLGGTLLIVGWTIFIIQFLSPDKESTKG